MLLPLLLLAACESGTIKIDGPDTGSDSDPSTVDTDTPGAQDSDPGETEPPDDTEPPGDTEPPDDTLPGPLGDLTEMGTGTFTTTESRFATQDCTLEYRKFTPDNPVAVDLAVILVHGFARNRDQMRGWAKHLASWGLTVYTPNLCHADFVDANHPKNGEELAAFANTHLRGTRVVFIGHSAGALSVELAATHAASTLGVLGLDLVDTEDLGVQAAPTITVPFYALFGDPNWACNADGNGVPVVQAAPDHKLFRVTDAVHCDFENPTDNACTTVCAWQFPGPAFNDRQQAKTIQAMMAGFALGISGVDARALDYWKPGRQAHDDLAQSGIVTAL